jgi:hypothetical protein
MSVSEEPDMDATQPRDVITHYFDLMGRGEDFATCYAEDVSWTTFDGGTVVSGPTEVRDYLTGLHRNMPDIQTRPIAYPDQAAYVEGDCADPRNASTDRIPFCIAYDIASGVITAARCYGGIGFLAPDGHVDSASGPS